MNKHHWRINKRQRKRAADQIKILKAKKAKMAVAAENESKLIDSEIAELENLCK